MGLVGKILGQTNPGEVLTTLYTVPGSTVATVQVIVCNTSIFVDTYRVSIAVAGAADNLSQYVAYNTSIDPNTTTTIGSYYLRAGDVLRVFASDTTLSFTAVGQETTQ